MGRQRNATLAQSILSICSTFTFTFTCTIPLVAVCELIGVHEDTRLEWPSNESQSYLLHHPPILPPTIANFIFCLYLCL